MALIASSSTSTKKNYDVFLSFRGEDTRNGITSHIYTALREKRIETYIDENSLERGDEISPALLAAIGRSKISVIVFSEDYASSSWCLSELVHIHKCRRELGQKVLPVFYEVDPSNVRKQDQGSYRDSMEKHEKNPKFKAETIEEWRFALKASADLSGFHYSRSNRSESALVKELVEVVMKELGGPVIPHDDFKGLIGMENHFIKLEARLINDLHEVRIIGIWGMPGIGKTTIADAVFSRLFPWFESSYFLKNVREGAEKHGLERLCDELIARLLGDEKLNSGILPNPTPEHAKDRLRRTKVLLVLDDVSERKQLEYLVGDHFGSGSRIIVTTRDEGVLRGTNIIEADIQEYKVELLSLKQSLLLFNLTAFRQNSSPPEFKELSSKAVQCVCGNPLAITVLGSHLRSLRNPSKQNWEMELEKLREFPHADILKKNSDFISKIQVFRKVDPDRWEFANEGFLGGQKHLLRSINRRKLAHGQSNQPTQPSHGQGSVGACVEVGKFGLEEEVEMLKRDKNVLMQELVRLRQQQQTTDNQLQTMVQRLQGMEQRQQQMMPFLAKAVQSPDFLAQFVQQQNESNRRITVEANKKRGLRQEGVPQGEYSASSDGQIIKYQPMVNEGTKALIRQILKMDTSYRMDSFNNSPGNMLISDGSLSSPSIDSRSSSSRASGVALQEVFPTSAPTSCVAQSSGPPSGGGPVAAISEIQPSTQPVISDKVTTPTFPDLGVLGAQEAQPVTMTQEDIVMPGISQIPEIVPEEISNACDGNFILPNLGDGFDLDVASLRLGPMPIDIDSFCQDAEIDDLLETSTFWDDFLRSPAAEESSLDGTSKGNEEDSKENGWNNKTRNMDKLTEQMELLSSDTKQGFRKVDPDRWEFANEGFLKGQKHLLRSINQRKPAHGQSNQQTQPSHGQGSVGACVEVGKFGLEEEVEMLKRDKNVLMQELVRLRQQQQTTDNQLQTMVQRLQGMEQRQQQMMPFLAKAVQSPGFLAQFVQQQNESNRRITVEANKKRGLRQEGVPQGEYSASSDGQIIKYQPMVNEGTKALIRQILKMDTSYRMDSFDNSPGNLLISDGSLSSPSIDSRSSSSRASGVTLQEVFPTSAPTSCVAQSSGPPSGGGPVAAISEIQPSTQPVISDKVTTPTFPDLGVLVGAQEAQPVPMTREDIVMPGISQIPEIVPEEISNACEGNFILPNLGDGFDLDVASLGLGPMPINIDSFCQDAEIDNLLETSTFWDDFLRSPAAEESSLEGTSKGNEEDSKENGWNNKTRNMDKLTEQMELLSSDTKKGFRKVDPDRWEFANEGFLRGQKHLLRSINQRKPAYGQSNQPTQPSHGQGLVGACVEVGKFGLEEEVEMLKRDKNVLMQELVRLRQQQQTTDNQLQTMVQRLQGMEQQQQQMMSFGSVYAAAKRKQSAHNCRSEQETEAQTGRHSSGQVLCLL